MVEPKITILPEGRSKRQVAATSGKASGHGRLHVSIQGAKESAKALLEARRRTRGAIASTHEEAAARIQAHFQAAAEAAYSRASTGRFARGIHTRVKIEGTDTNVKASIIVTAVNYRETKFLTNIGAGGYFKDYPVQPYRIFAKGVEGFDELGDPQTGRITKKSRHRAISFAKSVARSRLKVPRSHAFFEAFRRPGRGGGESRRIRDALGTPDAGDLLSSFFFYPLWVNHPGFERDVISDVAVQEGALYQKEVLTAVTKSHGEIRTAALVPSKEIPLPLTQISSLADTRTGQVVLDPEVEVLFRGLR